MRPAHAAEKIVSSSNVSGFKMSSWILIAAFGVFAVPITLFDIAKLRIPDLLSLGGIGVAVLVKAFIVKEPLLDALVEAGVGFGVFWLIHLLTRGKLGLGDAKYSAFIALTIGMHAWLMTLAVASVTGLACGLILIGPCGVEKTARVPFAPFLTLGAVVSIVMTL